MNEAPSPRANDVEVVSHFVRHRNAMAISADFGRIFEDHYLHLMQLGVRLDPQHDEMLKEALALLTLFLMSRPNNETAAWTMNFRDPPLNLFVTGDSVVGNVIGRVFTKDVKVGECDLFFAQLTRPNNPIRQSTVEIKGRDMLHAAEQFHRQSEQFPARYFRLGGDKYGMVVAHPDCDQPWFESLDEAAVERLAEEEELGFLERRGYHFACGCNLNTVLQVVVQAYGRDVDEILAGQEKIEVKCPRCGGSFPVDREGLESFLKDKG
jgi:molecular chaperone Hsp33